MVQLTILCVAVLLVPGGVFNKIWLNHSRQIVLLALLASFSINQIWKLTSQIGESIRETVSVHIRNLLLSICYLLLILYFSYIARLNLPTILVVNFVIYIIGSIVYLYRLRDVISFPKPERIKIIFSQMKEYCLPLIPYYWLSVFYIFADYWLLQYFGGAVQQGYYGIVVRFSFLAMLPTISVLQVLWKETAAFHAAEELDRIKSLYIKILRGFHFFAASVGCFIIPFSREIILLFLGTSYESAFLPMVLMFLYPMPHSLSQISGTILSGLGKTKVPANIGMVMMALSFPLSYLALAPSNAAVPGLNLGALGLVAKMLIIHLLEANLLAFQLCKYFQIPHKIAYQIMLPIVLVVASYLCKILSSSLLSVLGYHNFPQIIILSGIIFYGTLLTAVWFFPSLIGVSRQDLRQLKAKFIMN